MKVYYFFFFLILFPLFGCNCPGKIDAANLLEDSQENRQQEATEIVKLYPVSEWSDDILARISEKTGPEVAIQFRNQITLRLKEQDALALRLKIMTEVFTASELRSITHLLKDTDGKSAFKKFHTMDERLIALIAPELSKILSGAAS